MADGLCTCLDDVTFRIVREHVSVMVTATKAGMVIASVWSAAPVAGLFEYPNLYHGTRVDIGLSGGVLGQDR